MGSEVLTVDQVAHILRLHVMTIYRLAQEGKLPGFKVGSRWRFQKEALEAWMVDRAHAARLEGESERHQRKVRAVHGDR